MFDTAYCVAILTSEAMKYKLSLALLAAIWLVLHEEIASDPSTNVEAIIDKFFIIEVDCCKVIREDKLEVVLFGLYLPAPTKQK